MDRFTSFYYYIGCGVKSHYNEQKKITNIVLCVLEFPLSQIVVKVF